MQLLGLTITRTRTKATGPPPALSPIVGARGGGWFGDRGWYPVVRESFAGAWQQNIDLRPETILSYGPVWACVSLISQDIGKLRLRLVAQDANGIWTETSSPAFSPVLRKP